MDKMKITRIQTERLVRRILAELTEQKILLPKAPAEKIFRRAVEVLQADLAREVELDHEVHGMLDDLEKREPGGFQRHKMFLLLKKRLAAEKGIIL